MIFCVESDLILKRSFPGSFAIARVSGGDPPYPGNCDFSIRKVGNLWFFLLFWADRNSRRKSILCITKLLESHSIHFIILKRSFPRYFVIARISGGDQKIQRIRFFHKNNRSPSDFSLYWSDRSNSIMSMPVRSQLATRAASPDYIWSFYFRNRWEFILDPALQNHIDSRSSFYHKLILHT